jgi:hypothetical protein
MALFLLSQMCFCPGFWGLPREREERNTLKQKPKTISQKMLSVSETTHVAPIPAWTTVGA